MKGYIFSYDIEKDELHFSVELQQELLFEDTELENARTILLKRIHAEDCEQLLAKVRPVVHGKESI